MAGKALTGGSMPRCWPRQGWRRRWIQTCSSAARRRWWRRWPTRWSGSGTNRRGSGQSASGRQERDEMSAEGERSTLDGNAAGGLLLEVFAFDATVAPTTCAGCGRTRPMAELMLYAIELGAILRCPSCDQAGGRIGPTSRGPWPDLRGATTVVAADTATP